MSVAFGAVFSVFVLSMVALAVTALRWGVRRDRLTRRRAADGPESGGTQTGGPG